MYEVALIRTRWTGGERGVGVEEVTSDVAVLPTPKISDLSGLQAQNYSVGMLEVGTLTVSEISPRYSEDELVGNYAGGAAIPLDENFYWEVRSQASPGEMGERRRFTCVSAPGLDPLRFQWTIHLVRAQQDRSRSGEPRG